ncbi:Ankyrin-2 [Cichlidogyrus casuarinus]|uniref:Ankyrin-2 n=1 Tax=Cichlidogyrus casuarinus TaxID=1844966 RepID=A0ABD2QDS0_9PLAT
MHSPLWLVDCPDSSQVIELATKLYRLSTSVPYIGRFVVYGRRHHEEEAQLRCLCLIDDDEDKTLECQEGFDLVAAGPEVEVVQNQAYWLTMADNLVPISALPTKQLYLGVRAFEENRLHTAVRVKTPSKPHSGKIAFTREAKALEPYAK